MFRWKRILVCVILGTACWPSRVPASSDGASSVRTPLAVVIQRILGIPAGRDDYLPIYRRVVGYIRGERSKGLKYHQITANLDRNAVALHDMGELAEEVMHESNATALRRVLLSSLTLSLHEVGKRGSAWQYATVADRILLASCMTHIAIRLRAASHMRRSLRYARAAILLYAQDSVRLYGASSLGGWTNPKIFPWARRDRRALQMTPTQAGELSKVYWASVQRFQWLQNPSKCPLWAASRALYATGRREISPRALNHYIKALTAVIATVRGRLPEEFYVLRVVRSDVRGLAKAGHPLADLRIVAVLKKWAARVRAENGGSALDRKALLRWIKEASL